MKLMGKFVLAFVCLLSGAMTLDAAWTTRRLTTNAGASQNPGIAVWGENVYAVWEDDTPGNFDIFFRKSIDTGATWQTAKRLSTNQKKSISPSIAVSGPNVYVVWVDNTPLNDEIFFRKSTDGGVTWQNTYALTNTQAASENPDIIVSGSNVFLVWEDATPGYDEIYFRNSTDGGATWQPPKMLSSNLGNSRNPSIAVDGSDLFVVWDDDTPGNCDVYFRKSTDGGTTWQTARKLTSNAGESFNPKIVAIKSKVYVVWHDDTPGINVVYFLKSPDSGATWQAAKRLSNIALDSRSPAITVGGTTVCVAWYHITAPSGEIDFRKSTDGGATWQARSGLTNDPGDSKNPAIAVNAMNVYVIWQDDTLGNNQIYLRFSLL